MEIPHHKLNIGTANLQVMPRREDALQGFLYDLNLQTNWSTLGLQWMWHVEGNGAREEYL